jgi:PAS domain S-box-containing protein
VLVERWNMKSEDLVIRLEEAEDTLRAIREAAVDAFVVDEGAGSRVFMLEGADRSYSVLIEQMQQGAAVLDGGGAITYCNSSLAELLTVPHERLIGTPLDRFVAPAESAAYQTLLREGQVRTSYGEVNLQRKDGSEVPVRLTFSALAKARGGAVGVTITDLTTERHYLELAAANRALRESEAQLRAQEEQQKLLNYELTHRVKNILAVVQSLAHQTLHNAATTAEGCAAFEARLFALAKAHSLLINNSWAGAELGNLISEVIKPFHEGAANSRFSIEGPQIWLHPKAVVTFSMGLHELATNAAKYGALSSETGSVKLSWDVSQGEGQTFELNWVESGGPPVEMRRRRGFGSRLIEQGIAHDIGGRVRMLFAKEGLVCTINAPLDEICERPGNVPGQGRAC